MDSESDDDGGPDYISITTETHKRRKIELEGIIVDYDSEPSVQGWMRVLCCDKRKIPDSHFLDEDAVMEDGVNVDSNETGPGLDAEGPSGSGQPLPLPPPWIADANLISHSKGMPMSPQFQRVILPLIDFRKASAVFSPYYDF